jgi:hypothetical protein
MVGSREVPELKIQEYPPSMLRNVDSGPQGGARAGDAGALTINVKNIDGGPPGGARVEDLRATTINAKKRRW